jgi:flagellin
VRVSHNIASLNVYTRYETALAAESKAMTRISSGCKVNQASDDPYAESEDTAFNMQLKGLQMANQNAQDGVSLIQTAEGGLNGINSMMDTLKTLVTEAANGTETSGDNSDIQQQVSNIVEGINSLAQSTNMNGVNMLSTSNTLSATIGANVGENISIPTFNFTTGSGGLLNSLSSIDVTQPNGGSNAMTVVDSAISQISSALSTYGAIENRFSSDINNIGNLQDQVQQGDSGAVDADVAAEMLNYSQASVVVQAGIAMMAQTNKFPQQVLGILQNITPK